jgi:2-hydroxychromene-2-carboxylate isomerase
MPEPVAFYFDFLSPYAYIAWTQIHAIAARAGRELEVVPVLFAAILDAHGQKGPAEIPAKRVYTFKDAYRKAHKHGLPPLVPPPHHPFNPLLALRVASLPMPEDDRRRVVDALYAATWRDGTGVDSREAVVRALAGAGFDGERLAGEAEAPEIKALLRARTAEAIGRGVFGVPTLLVGSELFWGTDGLELAEQYLRGEDPIPPDLVLTDRTPSAVRPGSRSRP